MSPRTARNYNPNSSYSQHRRLIQKGQAAMFGSIFVHVARFIIHWTALFFLMSLPESVNASYYPCDATPDLCGGGDSYTAGLMAIGLIVMVTNSFRNWFDREPRGKDPVTARMRTALVWTLTVIVVVYAYRYFGSPNIIVIAFTLCLLADLGATEWLRRSRAHLAGATSSITAYNYVPHAHRRRQTL